MASSATAHEETKFNWIDGHFITYAKKQRQERKHIQEQQIFLGSYC